MGVCSGSRLATKASDKPDAGGTSAFFLCQQWGQSRLSRFLSRPDFFPIVLDYQTPATFEQQLLAQGLGFYVAAWGEGARGFSKGARSGAVFSHFGNVHFIITS